MLTPADNSPTACPHCGLTVPEGARICPHCGAGASPMHLAVRQPDAPTLADERQYWTQSKRGDIVAGSLGGFMFPPVFAFFLLWIATVIANTSSPRGNYLGVFIMFWTVVGVWGVTLFVLSRRLRSNTTFAAKIMRTWFGVWAVIAAVLLLGLVVTCIPLYIR